MGDFHRRLAQIGLAAAAEHGFALAGGYAVQAHGILQRPSEDVDLFTSAGREDFAVGALVFTHAPAVEGSDDVRGIYAAGFTSGQVRAYPWAYEPSVWSDLLYDCDFTGREQPHRTRSRDDHVGTLIVEAEK
ncbi:nucleotidyl transferase AbiEii/AbiGii toxin family protein [Actinoallomurus sp. NBC_01490]|uniref:nucleotidyl transferase AbiEii/AbiGii toxin family protein n=1 Tax=Actinoallomurus sp. NBC_01490 TaxID=2903557 RepID=UPI002E35DD39|nr:nucleotidyl transferase AbiEii/AbiGii toxin family protein [Actinoallomurus sp. NBC_01490]